MGHDGVSRPNTGHGGHGGHGAHTEQSGHGPAGHSGHRPADSIFKICSELKGHVICQDSPRWWIANEACRVALVACGSLDPILTQLRLPL